MNHEAHPMIVQMHAVRLRNVSKGCPGKRVIASLLTDCWLRRLWRLWSHNGLWSCVTDMISSSFISRLSYIVIQYNPVQSTKLPAKRTRYRLSESGDISEPAGPMAGKMAGKMPCSHVMIKYTKDSSQIQALLTDPSCLMSTQSITTDHIQ